MRSCNTLIMKYIFKVVIIRTRGKISIRINLKNWNYQDFQLRRFLLGVSFNVKTQSCFELAIWRFNTFSKADVKSVKVKSIRLQFLVIWLFRKKVLSTLQYGSVQCLSSQLPRHLSFKGRGVSGSWLMHVYLKSCKHVLVSYSSSSLLLLI